MLYKDYFEQHFIRALNLSRISAPLVVTSGMGLGACYFAVGSFLFNSVRTIYQVMRETEHCVSSKWAEIQPFLPSDITFLDARELHR
jgi:asparagine synthetase A